MLVIEWHKLHPKLTNLRVNKTYEIRKTTVESKWLSDWLTNSMQQSPSWEADSHAASQEIPRLLWNPRVHYRVHKYPPLVPILSQRNPVHIFPPYFSKIPHNIVFPSMLWSSEWSLSFRLSDQNCVHNSHLSYACYTPRPSHASWFDHLWWSVQVMKLLIMQSFSSLLPLPPCYVQIFSSKSCSQTP
jgi:hypothetical protein